jgi:hypothetical protein
MLHGAHRAVHIFGQLKAAMILLLKDDIGHSDVTDPGGAPESLMEA